MRSEVCSCVRRYETFCLDLQCYETFVVCIFPAVGNVLHGVFLAGSSEMFPVVWNVLVLKCYETFR